MQISVRRLFLSNRRRGTTGERPSTANIASPSTCFRSANDSQPHLARDAVVSAMPGNGPSTNPMQPVLAVDTWENPAVRDGEAKGHIEGAAAR
jgi:hypothetical protein